MSSDNFMAIIYENGAYHGYHCSASLDYDTIEDYKHGTWSFDAATPVEAIEKCGAMYLEYGYEFVNMPESKPDILDEVWDTWLESHDLIMELSFEHYMVCAKEQLREVFLHYYEDDMLKAMNEVVDLISLSINWLTWFGQDKEGIRELIMARLGGRMKGRTREIIEKYEKLRIEQDLSLWD